MEKQKNKPEESKEICKCFSQQKIEQLSRQPIIETIVAVSEDKKWLIHKTIITDIKPLGYYEKVIGRA
jgi:hypothetical protein